MALVCTGNYSRSGRTHYTASVNSNNAGGTPVDYEIVAAVPKGKRIVVMSLSLQTNATVTISILSGTTILVDRTGAASQILGDSPAGLFECAEAQSLALRIATAARVTGWITYIIEDIPT